MILISQQPKSPFDQAYGPNPVTITGMPVDPVTGIPQADKYVLQVLVNGEIIADIRQSPNQSGVAIFDIQNTLQNFVAPSKDNIEETGLIGNDLANSAFESVAYVLRASTETSGVVPVYPGDAGEWATSDTLLDFGGKKEYFEVPYNPTPYIPVLGTSPAAGCTTVFAPAQVFTERFTGRRAIDISNAGEGIPAFISGATTTVIEQNVTVDDMTTTSFFNGVSGTGPTLAQGIEAFVIYQYNGAVLLSTDIIYNTQGLGGGPQTATGQGVIPTYPYVAITAGTGPKNLTDFAGTLVTHYYVMAQPYSNNSCPSGIPNIADASMFTPMRFNIVDAACNDFPEFQFSWLNKYGFRDYYSFNKRNDRSVAIKRNTYLQEAANYASTSYNVEVYNRGTTVFSQALQENFTAFTDFISDEEAIYLESLFTSPDVKVRFNEKPSPGKYEWVPVSLLSTSYTQKTSRKDKLFQYDIKFKRAHNLKSQRG